MLGVGLEETFSQEVAVRNEGFEVLYDLVVQFGRFVEDADVVFEGEGVETIARRVSAVGEICYDGSLETH